MTIEAQKLTVLLNMDSHSKNNLVVYSGHALNGNWVVIFYPKHIASRGYCHDLLMYK